MFKVNNNYFGHVIAGWERVCLRTKKKMASVKNRLLFERITIFNI